MRKLLTFCLLVMSVTARGQLLISELLYQPHSGEAEYVELYNAGPAAVDLADFHIVRWVSGEMGAHYALPSFSVMSHTYVVLTTDAASVRANYTVPYPTRLIETSLPPYPNSGGSVILTTAEGSIVDRFDYTPGMHSQLLRDKAGVSLERRSFSTATNASGNWFSAASTHGYGTPTAPNSQSTEHLALTNDFSFSSDIISPDGDGYQDKLDISYMLTDGTLQADLRIFDAAGRPVRHLLNAALLGTSGSLIWDGRDESGHRCSPGRYVVNIILYDTHGTTQTVRHPIAVY